MKRGLTLVCHSFCQHLEVEAGGEDVDEGVEEETGEAIDLHAQMKLPWEGSDRDYGYQEVITSNVIPFSYLPTTFLVNYVK